MNPKLLQKLKSKIADTKLGKADGNSVHGNGLFNGKSWWAVNIAYFLAAIAALYLAMSVGRLVGLSVGRSVCLQRVSKS